MMKQPKAIDALTSDKYSYITTSDGDCHRVLGSPWAIIDDLRACVDFAVLWVIRGNEVVAQYFHKSFIMRVEPALDDKDLLWDEAPKPKVTKFPYSHGDKYST